MVKMYTDIDISFFSVIIKGYLELNQLHKEEPYVR